MEEITAGNHYFRNRPAARDTLETKTVATGKVEPRDEVLINLRCPELSELLKEAGQMVKSVKSSPELR